MKKQTKIALSILATAALAGCASAPTPADLDKMAAAVVKASFRDEGIVKTAVLDPEEVNVACTEADVAGQPLSTERLTELQNAQLKTIKWPANGNYMGDWKKMMKKPQMVAIATTATRSCQLKSLLAPLARVCWVTARRVA